MPMEKLLLTEWTIDKLSKSPGTNNYGYEVTRIELSYDTILTTVILLYPNDLKLLTGILECTEEELVGKKVTSVLRGSVVISSESVALGHQGMYFPINYRDNSSWLMPEHELCDLVGIHDIVRLNSKGKKILAYTVPSGDRLELHKKY